MDYEPREIEVLFQPDGKMRLGGRGFPVVALVDPDIPEKYHNLARYMNYGKTVMRATVGDMLAIYRLIGVTLSGLQMWKLLATRHTGAPDVMFIERGVRFRDDEKTEIGGWLKDP